MGAEVPRGLSTAGNFSMALRHSSVQRRIAPLSSAIQTADTEQVTSRWTRMQSERLWATTKWIIGEGRTEVRMSRPTRRVLGNIYAPSCWTSQKEHQHCVHFRWTATLHALPLKK